MSTPAFAQEEEAAGPLTLSGGIAVTSDYRFRGISLSNDKVAVQPTLTVSHERGFYAGVWGSTLPDSPAYGTFALDVYGGFNTENSPGPQAALGPPWYPPPGRDPSRPP